MLKHCAIFGFLVFVILAFSGCGKDAPQNTDTDKNETNKAAENKDADNLKNEEKKVEAPEKSAEIKLAAKPAELVKAIGKPGKFKILYYHLGICVTCQEIIAKFDMLKAQFSEDFEFFAYLSHELEAAGVKLEDFGINSMTPSTGYLFDAENKIVWKKEDPEFSDFTQALKNAGLAKEVYEPPLPPDFFE